MEILAVIALIGIIAVITTPIILGVINSSKEKAFIDSAYSLVTAARTYQADNGYSAVFEVNFQTKTNTDKLKIEGEFPDSGKLRIDGNGKVELAVWDDDLKICVVKTKNSKKVVKASKTKTQCTL